MYQPNIDALYNGTIDDASRELARIAYEVAEAHDAPYVTACAFFRSGEEYDWGMANAQNRNGEYTAIKMFYPAGDSGKEDSTDGQDDE